MLVLVAALTFAAAGVLAVVATTTSGGRSATARGLAQIDRHYVLGGAPPVPPARELSPLLVRLRDALVRVMPGASIAKLRHRLDVAGNPTGWRIERVLAYKGIGLLGLAVVGLLLGAGHGALLLVAPLVGGVLGFLLPDLLVHNMGTRRQEAMQKALADAMDMMTVCVEAGVGFDAALARVARNTSGPLAAEFARVLQEMQFGRSRVEALKALVERTNVAELKILVSALVQAAKLGIPVANVLREQASEMRQRRRSRAEEKAQKVTVKILFPLMFCLLPALFIVILGPGIINIVRTFSGLD